MKNPVEEHEARRVSYFEALLRGLVFRIPSRRNAERLPPK